MKAKSLFTGLVLCFPLFLSAQTRLPEEIAYRIKDEAFNNSRIEEMAQWMTDFMGPRLAGSQNGLRAEKLMEQKLEEMGFTNPRREFAMYFPKGGWDNEKTYVAMTSPYYTSFSATPKAWSGSTRGVIKGEVVYLNIEKEEDLEEYKGKLNGKIVLLPVVSEYTIDFDPLASRLTDEELEELAKDPRPQQERTYRRRVSSLILKINELLASEKPVAIFSGDGTFNVPSSRGVPYKAGDPEPTPEINLSIENHGRMARMINKGTPVEMEVEIKNRFTPADTTIYNVIAEIPGTDPKLKNEIVMIGAHFDSWHGGTGAADNASGCLVMLEAMRIIKELPVSPPRTIRIALWGGEEQGLYGSRGYAQKFLYDRTEEKKLPGYDSFVLYLNMDNGSGRFRGIYLEENDMAFPFFRTWMAPFETSGFTTLSPQRTGSTDHVVFDRLGLPAYQFIQDELEYDRTYHTLMDTYERLSLDDLRLNAAMVAWFALNAANDPARIPLKPRALEKLQKASIW